MENQKPSPYSSLISFSIKALIVMVITTTILNLIVPDFREVAHRLKKAAKDEKTRILLTSFIQNPAALYQAAEIDEKNGRVKDAISQMELAIGLLQMHNADPKFIGRYEDRLAEMIKNSKSSPATSKPTIDEEAGQAKPIKRWERN